MWFTPRVLHYRPDGFTFASHCRAAQYFSATFLPANEIFLCECESRVCDVQFATGWLIGQWGAWGSLNYILYFIFYRSTFNVCFQYRWTSYLFSSHSFSLSTFSTVLHLFLLHIFTHNQFNIQTFKRMRMEIEFFNSYILHSSPLLATSVCKGRLFFQYFFHYSFNCKVSVNKYSIHSVQYSSLSLRSHCVAIESSNVGFICLWTRSTERIIQSLARVLCLFRLFRSVPFRSFCSVFSCLAPKHAVKMRQFASQEKTFFACLSCRCLFMQSVPR